MLSRARISDTTEAGQQLWCETDGFGKDADAKEDHDAKEDAKKNKNLEDQVMECHSGF